MTLIHLPLRSAPFTQDNRTNLVDREADHRIANNLGLIASLLRLRARSVGQQGGPIDRSEVIVMLEEVAARVDTVARLHRLLSHSYQNALVDVGAYLRELSESLGASLAPDSYIHVSPRSHQACMLPSEQVLTLGLLASELVTNSMKYAHPAGLPVRIEISCGPGPNGSLEVEFVDDGVGMPEDFDPAVDGGLGLRVARSLAAQLGATLHFDSNELGTRVSLQIPISAAGAA